MRISSIVIKSILFVLALLTLLFLAVSMLLYFNSFNGALSDKPSDWAAFGSYLGGTAGAGMAFVAALALIATLYYQIAEFSAAFQEMERTSNALDQQQRIHRLEVRQQQLFEMISAYREAVEALYVHRGGRDHRSVEVIYSFRRGLRRQLERVYRGDFPEETHSDALKNICNQ